MTGQFMTDPQEMRAAAAKFDMYAQSIHDEARAMWASSENIGSSWVGTAQTASYGTMQTVNQNFNQIVNILNDVRDQLHNNANTYESQEHESQRLLGI